MRSKLIFLVSLVLTLPAFGQQAAYWDRPLTTTPSQTPLGVTPPLMAVPNATVSVCSYPATMVSGMCTNKITTYTDSTLGTACPSTAQLVMPGKNICVSQTDLQGNLGFWYNVASGAHLTYTVKSIWGTFGPYDILPNTGSGSFLPLTGGSVSGLISFPTDITPHPPLNVKAYGAVGDGTTDDTAAVQRAVNAAKAGAGNSVVYFPQPAVCYRITSSINVTKSKNIFLQGDLGGPQNSYPYTANLNPQICDQQTTGFWLFDFTGCLQCGARHLAIGDTPGTCNSTSKGAFLSLDTTNAQDGDGFRLDSVWVLDGSAAGASVFASSDQNQIYNSSLQSCAGPALIRGGTAGTATVTSAFVSPIYLRGNGVTHEWMSNVSITGFGSVAAFQMTGASQDEMFGNMYITADGPSTKIVELSGGCFHLDWNLRTEFHGNDSGGTTPATSLFFDDNFGFGGTIQGFITGSTVSPSYVMGDDGTGTNLQFQGLKVNINVDDTIPNTVSWFNLVGATWLGSNITINSSSGDTTAFGFIGQLDKTTITNNTTTPPTFESVQQSMNFGGFNGGIHLQQGSSEFGVPVNYEFSTEYNNAFWGCTGTPFTSGTCIPQNMNADWYRSAGHTVRSQSGIRSIGGGFLNEVLDYSADTGALPVSLNLSLWPSTSKLTLPNGQVIATTTPVPVKNVATLVAGTVTVSSASACAVGATCTYKLTNCGLNASTAVGTLSIGTVVAGTSFVINSESTTATVVTGDLSTVCWQIN